MSHEKGDKRVRQLRSDGGGEYDSYKSTKFRDDHGIVWEPIIPGNPQMNGAAEQLGQTLHKMANNMLKDSGFDLRYGPELVLTANYLRNRGLVVGRSLTPYEADTGHKLVLRHLRRIEQIGLFQSRKPHTGWRHWQDRAKRYRLIGYEGRHIYRMVDSEGKIKRYSRVAWINDDMLETRDRDLSPLPPPKRQRLISSSANLSPEQPVEFSSQAPDSSLDESNQENDEPQNFLFDFTNNANNPILSEPETSPLSSLRTTPDIPDPAPEISDSAFVPEKPVTRSQRTLNTELFSLLSSANSPEMPEPKTYR